MGKYSVFAKKKNTFGNTLVNLLASKKVSKSPSKLYMKNGCHLDQMPSICKIVSV